MYIPLEKAVIVMYNNVCMLTQDIVVHVIKISEI